MTTLLHSPLGVYVKQTAAVRGAVRILFDIAPEDCDFSLHARRPPRRKRRLVHWVHAAHLEGDMFAGIRSPLCNGELYFEAMQMLSDQADNRGIDGIVAPRTTSDAVQLRDVERVAVPRLQ